MSPRIARGAGPERGAIAGIEALPFGMLLFVAGTLFIANIWAVIDAKDVSEGARQQRRCHRDDTYHDDVRIIGRPFEARCVAQADSGVELGVLVRSRGVSITCGCVPGDMSRRVERRVGHHRARVQRVDDVHRDEEHQQEHEEAERGPEDTGTALRVRAGAHDLSRSRRSVRCWCGCCPRSPARSN